MVFFLRYYEDSVTIRLAALRRSRSSLFLLVQYVGSSFGGSLDHFEPS
jgi:hypothetical protein